MNWKLMDVIESTGATPNRLPEKHPVLTGVSTDSRTLKRGELFVALKGPNFEGHRFVDTAVKKGAGAILAQELVPCPKEVPCLFVPDTLRAYGALASTYRKNLKTKFLAITGSMGKTSTKEMAAAILGRKYRVAKTDKNENNRVGVPKTLLKISPETEAAVVELGSNIPGEIALLTEIIQPDKTLLTNIAPVHLEHFKTIKGVRIEKSALFWRAPGSALRCVNLDDSNIREIPLVEQWPTLTYGSEKEANVTVRDIIPQGLKGTRFRLTFRNENVEILLPLLGLHQVNNALAAAVLGLSEGIPLTEIKAALEEFHAPGRRLEPIFTPSGWVIINDTYNANPVATAMAIQTLAMFSPDYFTIALLGDMLELGEESDTYHERIGAECAKRNIGLLGLTGAWRESIRKGAVENGLETEKIFFFDDTSTLLRQLSSHFRKPAMLLVKGSNSLNMNRWVEAILAHIGEEGGKQ
jgi:UDP-N-acetylmuramoyl-tripeptide--D-alanyl-D-alanine ligase